MREVVGGTNTKESGRQIQLELADELDGMTTDGRVPVKRRPLCRCQGRSVCRRKDFAVVATVAVRATKYRRTSIVRRRSGREVWPIGGPEADEGDGNIVLLFVEVPTMDIIMKILV